MKYQTLKKKLTSTTYIYNFLSASELAEDEISNNVKTYYKDKNTYPDRFSKETKKINDMAKDLKIMRENLLASGELDVIPVDDEQAEFLELLTGAVKVCLHIQEFKTQFGAEVLAKKFPKIELLKLKSEEIEQYLKTFKNAREQLLNPKPMTMAVSDSPKREDESKKTESKNKTPEPENPESKKGFTLNIPPNPIQKGFEKIKSFVGSNKASETDLPQTEIEQQVDKSVRTSNPSIAVIPPTPQEQTALKDAAPIKIQAQPESHNIQPAVQITSQAKLAQSSQSQNPVAQPQSQAVQQNPLQKADSKTQSQSQESHSSQNLGLQTQPQSEESNQPQNSEPQAETQPQVQPKANAANAPSSKPLPKFVRYLILSVVFVGTLGIYPLVKFAQTKKDRKAVKTAKKMADGPEKDAFSKGIPKAYFERALFSTGTHFLIKAQMGLKMQCDSTRKLIGPTLDGKIATETLRSVPRAKK